MDPRLLRKAAEVFLRLAYPSGAVPEVVRERLCFEGATVPEILQSEHVEKEASSRPDGDPGRFTVRLGSDRYPHMKMVLERCSTCEDFFFSVDTHDRHFLFDEKIPPNKKARWVALQEYNRLLKRAIEDAWEREGVPTFASFTLAQMGRERTPVPAAAADAVGMPLEREGG